MRGAFISPQQSKALQQKGTLSLDFPRIDLKLAILRRDSGCIGFGRDGKFHA